MNELQEKIKTLVLSVSQAPDSTPTADESLFDSEILDSFGLTDLVSALEKEFGVRVADSDLRPENFRSIQAIETYIQKHRS